MSSNLDRILARLKIRAGSPEPLTWPRWSIIAGARGPQLHALIEAAAIPRAGFDRDILAALPNTPSAEGDIYR